MNTFRCVMKQYDRIKFHDDKNFTHQTSSIKSLNGLFLYENVCC